MWGLELGYPQNFDGFHKHQYAICLYHSDKGPELRPAYHRGPRVGVMAVHWNA